MLPYADFKFLPFFIPIFCIIPFLLHNFQNKKPAFQKKFYHKKTN